MANLPKEDTPLGPSVNRLYKAAIARRVTPDLQRRIGNFRAGSARILYVNSDEEASQLAAELRDALVSFGWKIDDLRHMTPEEQDWAPLIGSHITTSRTDASAMAKPTPRIDFFRELLGGGPGAYGDSALPDNSFIVKIGHNKAILWDWAP